MGANTTVAKSVTMTSDREPIPPALACDRASSSRAHHAKATPRANPMSGARGAGKGHELYLNRAGSGNPGDALAQAAGRRNWGRHPVLPALDARSMDVKRIQALLEAVRAGTASPDEALSQLRDLPFRDLGFATVDHHRALRTGMPEVILGEPKTAEQIAAIAEELARTKQNVLITRLDAAKAALIKERISELRYVARGPHRDAGGDTDREEIRGATWRW